MDMGNHQKEVALEYIQQNVNPHIIGMSDAGMHDLMERYYPGGIEGFKADYVAGYKS